MKKLFGVVISIVVVLLLAYGFIDYSVRSAKPDFAYTEEEQLDKLLSETVIRDVAVPMAEESGMEENTTEQETEVEAEVIEQPIVRYINFREADEMMASAENAASPITLSLVSEQGNGVSDIEPWVEENELSLPMLEGALSWHMEPREDAPIVDSNILFYDTAFYDENYIYHWSPDTLDIYDRENCKLLYVISYESDRWYLMGNCAYLRDGILYIGNLYNGYAMPNTCFIVAYDIEKDEILWRSEDQTFNTMNFIVKGDVILSGYGFTSEKDYIYQIDINTGNVISKTELSKKPDMLIEKDGQLYVHTYSIDYVFDME
ncbi:MAG: hypothetical protein E7290_04820 [Lachnospiraceae bacterium]|nr:hypothetical protein [Lachnospiraceae bacterium]